MIERHWIKAYANSGNLDRSYLHSIMATPEEMIERKARREVQAADGKVAMAEYLAEPEQRAANTAKLREARLARDAAAALLPVEKKTRKKKAP
jgi:hypothetical protein